MIATFILTSSLPGIFPPIGTVGTKVSLNASDLGTTKGKVLIGGTATKILNWSDSSIHFEIMKALPAGSYDVVVKPKEPRGAEPIIYEDAFTMMPPEIISVEPDSGSIPDEIEISGNYFGSKKVKVYLEYEQNGRLKKKSCKILEWSMFDPVNGDSQIRFIVPKTSKTFPPDTYQLKVTNKVGTGSATFTVE